MFTGLIETTGRIDALEPTGSGARLRVRTAIGAELTLGESVAVSGVCLTAADVTADGFSADLSPATLSVTTLGRCRTGQLVNLERPVRADARMGGHFVLGHVDAVGIIHALRHDGDCVWLDVDVPAALSPYLISKGSIAVDGISLTVAALEGCRVGLQIVPFTFAHTALAEAGPADPVNIEADVLGKYVARLLATRSATNLSLPVPS
ncbi:MAG: riboflavin synthase [Vicinamibacterales bacterium]